MSLVDLRGLWAVTASRDSSWAPLGLRRRKRSSFRIGLSCAKSISTFLRCRRYVAQVSVAAIFRANSQAHSWTERRILRCGPFPAVPHRRHRRGSDRQHVCVSACTQRGHDVTVVARPGSRRLAQLQRDNVIVDIDGTRAKVRVLDRLDEETAYDLAIVRLLALQVGAILPTLSRSAAQCVQFMFNTF